MFLAMPTAKTSYMGDPNIGLHGLATDKYCVIPEAIPALKKLSVPVVNITVAQTDLAGVFLAGNSNTILVPNIMTRRMTLLLERGMKKASPNTKIVTIRSKYTALGNLIACNDRGALVSELLKPYKKTIENALGVPVTIGRLLGLNIIGSLCAASNKGFLLNMHAEKKDFELCKKALKVDGDIGTVNFGSPFVRSGLIVNSKAVLVGNQTTGPETVRIEEAFGFI